MPCCCIAALKTAAAVGAVGEARKQAAMFCWEGRGRVTDHATAFILKQHMAWRVRMLAYARLGCLLTAH